MTYNDLNKSAEKNNQEIKVSESARLADAVTEYNNIRAKIKELDAALLGVRNVLETATAKTADGVLVVAGFKVSLIDASRESFSLSSAREFLSKEDQQKYLDPYTKETSYKTLKVKELEG